MPIVAVSAAAEAALAGLFAPALVPVMPAVAPIAAIVARRVVLCAFAGFGIVDRKLVPDAYAKLAHVLPPALRTTAMYHQIIIIQVLSSENDDFEDFGRFTRLTNAFSKKY